MRPNSDFKVILKLGILNPRQLQPYRPQVHLGKIKRRRYPEAFCKVARTCTRNSKIFWEIVISLSTVNYWYRWLCLAPLPVQLMGKSKLVCISLVVPHLALELQGIPWSRCSGWSRTLAGHSFLLHARALLLHTRSPHQAKERMLYHTWHSKAAGVTFGVAGMFLAVVRSWL